MRRCLILIGLTGIVTAIFSLREILCIAGGNEIIWPAALSAMLFALLAGKTIESICERLRPGVQAFSLLLLLSGIIAPATILLIRGIHFLNLSNFHPEFPELLAVACGAAPLVIVGALHGMSCRILERSGATFHGNTLPFIGLGCALGGLGIFLLPNVSALKLSLAVAAFDSIAAFMVLRNASNHPAWNWLTPLAAVLAVAMMLSPFGTVVDFLSRAANIPDGKLLDVNDSTMGRVALMEAVAGKSIHYNGARVEDVAQRPAAVRTAYLSILSHQLPRRMLFIGGTAADCRSVLAEFPWIEIHLAHVGPEILRTSLPESPELPARVVAETKHDARTILKERKGQFDVVIMALPATDSVMWNRMYTRRFFEEVKGSLAGTGVFAAVVLRESNDPSVLEAPAAVMAAGIRSVFPSVASASAGDGQYVLASTQPIQGFPLPSDWQRRVAGWRIPRGRDVMHSLPVYWERRSNTRLAVPFSQAGELQPLPLIQWLNAKSPGLTRHLDVWTALMAMAVIIGILAMSIAFSSTPGELGHGITRGVIGAAGAGAITGLILGMQALSGHAYSGMLFVMCGVLLGAGIGKAIAWSLGGSGTDGAMSTICQLALGVFCAACAPLLIRLSSAHAGINTAVYAIGAASAVIGIAAGLALGFGQSAPSRPGRPENNSSVAELLGAMMGASTAGLILVPAIGLPFTFFLLAAVVLLGLCLPLLASRR